MIVLCWWMVKIIKNHIPRMSITLIYQTKSQDFLSSVYQTSNITAFLLKYLKYPTAMFFVQSERGNGRNTTQLNMHRIKMCLNTINVNRAHYQTLYLLIPHSLDISLDSIPKIGFHSTAMHLFKIETD